MQSIDSENLTSLNDESNSGREGHEYPSMLTIVNYSLIPAFDDFTKR